MINCLYIEGNGLCSNENSVCYQGKCEFEEGCEVCTTHRVYKIPIDAIEDISVAEQDDVIEQIKEETEKILSKEFKSVIEKAEEALEVLAAAWVISEPKKMNLIRWIRWYRRKPNYDIIFERIWRNEHVHEDRGKSAENTGAEEAGGAGGKEEG